MSTNILNGGIPQEQISKYFSLIGQPARIQILMVISEQDACVCHIETVLGIRQASISQHLMVLRKAGLVTTHRDGRNIFYHLEQPDVIDLLKQAAKITGCEFESLKWLTARPIPGCPCPQCNPGMDPQKTCRPDKIARTSSRQEC
jgi:ArsR family transcriptional regulator